MYIPDDDACPFRTTYEGKSVLGKPSWVGVGWVLGNARDWDVLFTNFFV